MLKSRYDYMLSIIPLLKPKIIIEVGIARALRSVQMIKMSQKHNKKISYIGYDVFDTKDQIFHNSVGNCKSVYSKDKITSIISLHTKSFVLHQGTTEETLWGRDITGDLAFIDGDHRVESIYKDFHALKNSRLIVFDDYYINSNFKNFSSEKFGCKTIINNMNSKNYYISPPSIELPEIRIAFYSKNENIISNLNTFFKNFH